MNAAPLRCLREGAGVPLLLLPGTLCDEALFAPVLARLPPDRPVLIASLTGAQTMADMARLVLLAAPERFALCGFSLGGILALEIAHQAPRRVERLALLDTTAKPDPSENAARRRGDAERAAREGTDGGLVESFDRLVAPCHAGDAALRDAILGMGRRVGAAALSIQAELAIHRADGRPRLPLIGVPTLVLAGAEERVCPVEAHREIADAIPDARLVLVPDAGHFAPLEQPDAVARHLERWLAVAPHPSRPEPSRTDS